MPDLMIEHVRTCASNLRWSKKYPSQSVKGVTYTVVYGPVSGGKYSHGYVCDCPAGQRGRPCKHVKQAEEDRCGWGIEAFMGSHLETNPDKTCPECGGPTEVIRVGV